MVFPVRVLDEQLGKVVAQRGDGHVLVVANVQTLDQRVNRFARIVHQPAVRRNENVGLGGLDAFEACGQFLSRPEKTVVIRRLGALLKAVHVPHPALFVDHVARENDPPAVHLDAVAQRAVGVSGRCQGADLRRPERQIVAVVYGGINGQRFGEH